MIGTGQFVIVESYNTSDVKQNEWRPRTDDLRRLDITGEWVQDQWTLTDRSLMSAPRGVRPRLFLDVQSHGYTSVQAYSGYDALTTVLGDVLGNSGWYFMVAYTDGGAYTSRRAEIEDGSYYYGRIQHEKRLGAQFVAAFLRADLRTSLTSLTGDDW